MRRTVTITAAGILSAAAVWFANARLETRQLWPGARFSEGDRERAQLRGLFFLYSAARQPTIFADWGHDLLSAFVNLASTSGDRDFSDLAWRMGHERALAWRRLYPRVKKTDGADEIASLIYGSDAADALGAPDPGMREALRRAASRFSTADFLGFDPKKGPPAGADRYSVFQDALIDSYTFDHYGIPLSAHFSDVLRWLPKMHPYPTRKAGYDAYYDSIYTVTHVVYTYNSYNQDRIAPACFPDEFRFLEGNLNSAIQDRDPETLGEYLDTLQSFGLTWSDSKVRRAVEYLLGAQNPDGSWGDPRERDMYVRYHSTWTGINGIQTFRPRRLLPCPEFRR